MALCRFLDVAQRGLAPATLRAVRADARVFAAWCGARGLSWLPATPETVYAFLQDAGATRNPCDHWSVTLERRSHAREHGSTGAPADRRRR